MITASMAARTAASVLPTAVAAMPAWWACTDTAAAWRMAAIAASSWVSRSAMMAFAKV
ncbi:MAG: hypothetical protein ACFB0G_21065 [Leptolyngbyaceae cyanobacterium]